MMIMSSKEMSLPNKITGLVPNQMKKKPILLKLTLFITSLIKDIIHQQNLQK